jgi:dihydroorotate dehydrogenase (NAD+) catalytic subunit
MTELLDPNRRPTLAAAVDLTTTIGSLRLANPVMTASGCAAAGRELGAFLDPAALGAVVTKSILRDPRSGRPTPRMAETPAGMLNSIGLQGPGIDAFLEHDLPWLARAGGGRAGGEHLLPERGQPGPGLRL